MMSLYYKTKDGQMIWVDNVVHLELNGIENGTIHDGQWTFDLAGKGTTNGTKDV